MDRLDLARTMILVQAKPSLAAFEDQNAFFDEALAVEGNLAQRVVLPEAFVRDNAADLGGIAHNRQDAVFSAA